MRFGSKGKDSEVDAYRRRATPSTPYAATVDVLTAPIAAIELTAGVFAAYAMRRLESVCFWYGDRDESSAIVRAVVIPEQRNSWGNYHVTANAMDGVARATRDRGWKNLAQLHTHPGRSIEHSLYDDEHANSRRALSLVLPFYGRRVDEQLILAGIHEWQRDFWHLLPATLAARRTRIVGGGADTNVALIDVREASARGASSVNQKRS
jgi:hypothetical protein